MNSLYSPVTGPWVYGKNRGRYYDGALLEFHIHKEGQALRITQDGGVYFRKLGAEKWDFSYRIKGCSTNQPIPDEALTEIKVLIDFLYKTLGANLSKGKAFIKSLKQPKLKLAA